MSIADSWCTTPSERAESYPCDALFDGGNDLFRAVDVNAPADVTFRRLCHLRVAPYSYDWLDNGGRQSPRDTIHGVEALSVGDRIMRIFTLASFERDAHLTLRLTAPRGRRMFGDIAVSYVVTPVSASRSRLIAKLRVAERGGPLRRLRFALLAWGDLIMMRKQLLTLAHLAERDCRAIPGRTDAQA